MPDVTSEAKALVALLALRDGSTASAATDNLYAALDGAYGAIEDVRARASAVERAVRRAESVEEEASVYAHFRRVKSKTAVVQQVCVDLSKMFDRLADASYALDQIGETMRLSIAMKESPSEETRAALVRRAGTGIARPVIARPVKERTP